MEIFGADLLQFIKILGLEMEYAFESNPFGGVKSGRIHMKGSIVGVHAMMNDDGDFFFLSHGYQIEGSTWHPDETPADLDDEVLCLSFASGRNGLYGLTVAKVEGRDDEYVRTGVFYLVGHDGHA